MRPELPPLPAPHGRIRRFARGDWVRVSYGGTAPIVGQVMEWWADPVHFDAAFGEPQGPVDVRYRLSNHIGCVQDWQLEAVDYRSILPRLRHFLCRSISKILLPS